MIFNCEGDFCLSVSQTIFDFKIKLFRFQKNKWFAVWRVLNDVFDASNIHANCSVIQWIAIISNYGKMWKVSPNGWLRQLYKLLETYFDENHIAFQFWILWCSSILISFIFLWTKNYWNPMHCNLHDKIATVHLMNKLLHFSLFFGYNHTISKYTPNKI